MCKDSMNRLTEQYHGLVLSKNKCSTTCDIMAHTHRSLNVIASFASTFLCSPFCILTTVPLRQHSREDTVTCALDVMTVLLQHSRARTKSHALCICARSCFSILLYEHNKLVSECCHALASTFSCMPFVTLLPCGCNNAFASMLSCMNGTSFSLDAITSHPCANNLVHAHNNPLSGCFLSSAFMYSDTHTPFLSHDVFTILL